MSNKIHKNVVEGFDGDVEGFIEKRKELGYSQQTLSMVLGLANVSVIGHFELGEFTIDERTFTLFRLLAGTHPRYRLIKKNEEHGFLVIDPPATGKGIRTYRNNAKLTQLEMAELMNLSTGKYLISNYENERKNPSKQGWTVFLLATNQHPFYKIEPIDPSDDTLNNSQVKEASLS